MAKSKWKLNYYNNCVFKQKFLKMFFNKKTNERYLYFRNSCIPFFFLNRVIRIHKGNYFNFVLIDRFSIGFKFGEFSVTRKPFHYPLKKKKKIMGQKSISTLNKVGYSMYWGGMWDDKIQFSKNLQKNLILIEIFESIFNNNTSLNLFKSNYNFFLNCKKFKNYKIFYSNKLDFLYTKFLFEIFFF